MTRTIVPQVGEPGSSIQTVLETLEAQMEVMSPQLRKAAAYVLDHPDDVGFSSVRQLADSAEVKPNTLMRMARAVGFEGFDEFREPFREDLRSRTRSFPDRAQWLQEISAEGRLGSLYADAAGSAIDNLSAMYASITADELEVIADRVVESHRSYIIGVGANYSLAHNFAYLVGMALDNVIAIPNQGNAPMDGIVRAGPSDVVIAMTFEPYRSEVVETTEAARAQGAAIVAITDSHGSPIAAGADHVILAPSETPQFFPSTLAAAAALETLASFIIADADKNVVSAIDRFHQRRYDLGVYWKDDR